MRALLIAIAGLAALVPQSSPFDSPPADNVSRQLAQGKPFDSLATDNVGGQLAQGTPPSAPRFEHGEAQPVFAGEEIVRHDVWVEIANLDTDRDGAWDRIRLQVHRPASTERGTRLPVVL